MFIEIRSEREKGKLLFKWDPQNNIIDIVLRDTLYSVKLNNRDPKGEYEIINKKSKNSKK